MAVTLLRGPGVSRVPGLGVSRQSGLSNGSRLWEIGDASGLPRNGLVALYDPYRDAYGRNVLETAVASMGTENVTIDGSTFLETSATGGHNGRLISSSYFITSPFWMSVTFTPIGRKRFLLGRASVNAWALVDTETVTVVATGATGADVSIVANGDGSYTAKFRTTGPSSPWLCSMPDDATSSSAYSFAGDTSKGFTLHQWQLNLGSTLFPYSAPVGAPGTLQTLADYSGLGNHGTLGATTGASTDDPAFTGLGLLFAGDYVKSGNLAGVTMAGDWSLPIVCKPSGTSGAIVSLADATAADQYQAIEFNGSTKVRIHTKNGATDTASSDLTVSNSTVQMLSLVSSGNTLTLKRMDTGTYVTATNADPTGTPRLVIGGLGVSTIGTLADGLDVNLLTLYGRALSVSEETRIYRHVKSLFAGRGVTVA